MGSCATGLTADFNDASNFLDTFRKDSPNNDSGYTNDTFDALLNEAARASDPETRRLILEAAERVMLNGLSYFAIVFFCFKTPRKAVRTRCTTQSA